MARSRPWKSAAPRKNKVTTRMSFPARERETTSGLELFESLEGTGPGWPQRGLKHLDATQAIALGAEDAPVSSGSYAKSFAELLHRAVENKVKWSPSPSYLIVGWAVVIGWLFIQDNSKGKVDDWPAILIFLQTKAAFITLVFVVVVVLMNLVKRFKENE